MYFQLFLTLLRPSAFLCCNCKCNMVFWK